MHNHIKQIMLLAVVFTSVFHVNFVSASQDKLVFATEIIRHGERYPSMELPGFPNEDKTTLEQLTEKGIEQAIALGRQEKETYINQYNLLHEKYKPYEIYARSTDIDRAIISANAFLIGMYDQHNRPQPVAVHTIPLNDDELLLGYLTHYDRIDQLSKSNPELVQLARNLKPTLDRLSLILNMNIETINTFNAVADTLYIRKQLNQDLPAELSSSEIDEYYNTMRKASAIVFKSRDVGALASNKLIYEIGSYVNKVVDNKQTKKFVLFGTHDVTLLGFLSALEVPLEYNPDYSSHISILLFSRENQSGYYIKFFFNDTELKIPGCRANTYCSIEEFHSIQKKVNNLYENARR